MPRPLLISLIAISANLVAMVLVYSFMANTLVRLHWRRRGVLGVLAMIFVAGLFWIVPPFALRLGGYYAPPDSFWFGNWLVSGCSVIILCQRVRWIPRELEDLARTDGCGWFGTYRHIVLPLVRRELALIALLTLMATTLHLWIAYRPATDFPPPIDFPPWIRLFVPLGTKNGPSLALAMITGSLVMTMPVILIFLLARRYLEGPSIRLGEAKLKCPGAE